jgi:hypothetical protein
MSPDELLGYVLNKVAIIHDRQNTARTTPAPAFGSENMLNVRQLTRISLQVEIDYQHSRCHMAHRMSGGHVSQHSVTKRLAATILAREGIAAIWELHVAAAEAYRMGHPCAAASILEIAEAAEDKCVRARGGLRARLADVIGSLA